MSRVDLSRRFRRIDKTSDKRPTMGFDHQLFPAIIACWDVVFKEQTLVARAPPGLSRHSLRASGAAFR